ncbi:MAG: hypothetical protein ACKO7Q_01210, partial [Actinomycetota bacterium]
MSLLIAYADLHEDALVGPLLDLAEAPDDEVAAAEAARAALELELPVGLAIALAVVASEGPFAVAARHGMAADDPRVALAGRELARVGELAHGDAARLLARHGLDGALGGRDLAGPERDAIPVAALALADRLAAEAGWAGAATDLAAFHAAEGTGTLAISRVLRWVDGELIGVPT